MDGFITLNQTLFGQEVLNVLAFSNLLDDGAWRQAVADAFRASLAGATRVDRVTDWSFDSVTFSYIAGAVIDFSVDVVPTQGQLAGQALSEGLPPTNALLVSTQYAGIKPNRGRIYFAGMGEAAQSNGIWNTQVVNRFQDLVLEWRDGIGPATQQIFLHIASRPTITRPSFLLNPVSTAVGRSVVATQRRRRIGSGS